MRPTLRWSCRQRASPRHRPSTARRSRSTGCVRSAAPRAGKRCIDKRKPSRPPAKITHLARGWLDRPCRRCGAQPGERCRTPSGRDADPHTPRRARPSVRRTRATASTRRSPVPAPATVDEPRRRAPALPASDLPPAPAHTAPASRAAPRSQGLVHGELVGAADDTFVVWPTNGPDDVVLRGGGPGRRRHPRPAR
jgi:hypothetical protein